MMRLAALFWLAVAAIVALFLFHVKYEVQHLEDRLEQAHAQINRDQVAIHILEAEWSHLNRPDRIGRLAEKHLGLQSAQTSQLASLQIIPSRPLDAGPVEAGTVQASTGTNESPGTETAQQTPAREEESGAQIATASAPQPSAKPSAKPVAPVKPRHADLPAAVRTTLASMGSLR
ncbi:MAG: hypothetical protein R3316_00770 [Rhodovibrionaceae bacterium]|nr:hypothetical protein [Rhodovibrionaceae bacterium]